MNWRSRSVRPPGQPAGWHIAGVRVSANGEEMVVTVTVKRLAET